MDFILTLIRSILFNICFAIWTFVVPFFGLPTLFLPFEKRFVIPRLWTKGTVVLLRYICGITHEVRGAEYLPTTPCIIACKHQSAWETIIFFSLRDYPCYILKEELLRIPVVGLYMLACQMIAIQRKNSPSVIKSLIKRAKNRIETYRMTLVIFPEGTRTAIGGPKQRYQSGIAALYQALEVPIVPAALNAGKCWSRNAFFKYPGKITIEFLPPIQPGLKREALMEELEAQIEGACERLG